MTFKHRTPTLLILVVVLMSTANLTPLRSPGVLTAGENTAGQDPIAPPSYSAINPEAPAELFQNNQPSIRSSAEYLVGKKTSAASRNSRDQLMRIPGGVSPALTGASKLAEKIAADTPMTLTLVMKRTDQARFDRYLQEVNNPQSPLFHHFLSQRELTSRYGPTRTAYGAILNFLQHRGFQPILRSSNRLTLSVRGTRAQVESTFSVNIRTFEKDGRRFFSNDTDPALPRSIAKDIIAVTGLSNLTAPQPATQIGEGTAARQLALLSGGGSIFGASTIANLRLLLDLANRGGGTVSFVARNPAETVAQSFTFSSFQIQQALSLVHNYALGGGAGVENGPNLPTYSKLSQVRSQANLATGAGQKIGVLGFSSVQANDIADFLALAKLPASLINRFSQVAVNGGAPLGPGETDVLLSIQVALIVAPGAQVVVYHGSFTDPGVGFQALFNSMINDGVTVISNNFYYCEDQTTAADVQSINSILAAAAASGISVFNATGDSGSRCSDGNANTIAVPADSPNATAVGGTSLKFGPGFTYGSESWWDGSGETPPSGQSGYGVSRFFSRPAYQNGYISAPMRSVPDVTAPADPIINGSDVCQADAGGCPTGRVNGGTSIATPIWAAFAALLNEAAGRRLGLLNPLLYPLAGTNVFHSPASMGSDPAHVGLGTPNVDLLSLALTGSAAGPLNASTSSVILPLFNTVRPVPGTIPADGSTVALVLVKLRDTNGHMVIGKTVTLTANPGSHAVITPASGISSTANGAVAFTVTNSTVENLTFTATADGVQLTQTATINFTGPPAAAGSITASPTTVTANGSDTTTIIVTLKDAKGNPAPGKVVNLSQGNGSSIISTTTASTDASGRALFTAVANKAESVTYTAFDVTDSNLPVPGSATVNFVNASGFCADRATFNFGTAAPGYSVTTFASNFPNDCFAGIGPLGIAFDATGDLLVGNLFNSILYRFGRQGGIAGPATQVGLVQAGVQLGGLAFSKDGRLYATLKALGTVVELNQTTGAVIRTVVNYPDAIGLAIDPISGDLFVSSQNGVQRISNFAAGPGTLTPYFSGDVDGIVFTPDGTLYAAVAFNRVVRVSGTNTATPGVVTTLVFVPNVDGIATEPNPANPSKPFLYVNRLDGIITRIDTGALPDTPPSPCGAPCTDIYTGGSRGDFVTVGPSGCLYATQSDRVIRITKADGTCSLVPTYPAPQLVLTPEEVQPSPAQGNSMNFTATLRNLNTPVGTPIVLTIMGPNLQTILARTDAQAKAHFTYRGIFTGTDDLAAIVTVGTQTLTSNVARVIWTPGKHSTFLSLNLSPHSGAPNKSLSLRADLVNVSLLPAVPISGASIMFTLAGQTCVAITDNAGSAVCSITPTAPVGRYQLNATFAGNSQFLQGAAIKPVDLIATVAPTLQLNAASFSVNEGTPRADVTITRSGDAGSGVSVDFSTNDNAGLQDCDVKNGTASPRCDFIYSTVRLNFAAGEASKTVSIGIIDDTYAEGPESLTVSLSNPVGATLSTPVTATITITDNDTADTANPLSSDEFFIRQHYIDFLGREPEPAGLAGWRQILQGCGTTVPQPCDRIEVSSAFFRSAEFQGRGYFIYRFYPTVSKIPVYSEYIADFAKVSGFLTDQQLEANKVAYVNEVIARTEFQAKYSSTFNNPTAYVDALLQTVGLPNHPSRAGWIATLNSSNTVQNRALVLRQLVESAEVYNKYYNEAFVIMQYFGYLRRTADASYLSWIQTMTQTNGDYRIMINGFMNSAEYRRRFGP